MTKPLILVNFSVPPDVAPQFTVFYHHEFLPRIMENAPEIFNIRRYEEFGVGASLRWYNKQYLTIYQLVDESAIAKSDEIFQNSKVTSVVAKFREWKEK